jgi:hypothetical protein
MPAAVLTKGEWEEVKMASIAGIPDTRISKDWGISRDALRKRRERESWPTPERARIERDKAREALQNKEQASVQSSHGAEVLSQDVQSKPSAAEVIAKSKEEYGESNRMVLLSKLSPILQSAVTENPANFSPQDIKELVSLGSFLHKMADLDKPQTEVNVSLWSTQQPQSERDVTPSHADDVMDSMLD